MNVFTTGEKKLVIITQKGLCKFEMTVLWRRILDDIACCNPDGQRDNVLLDKFASCAVLS